MALFRVKKAQCKNKLEHGVAFVLVFEFNQSGVFITKSWLCISKMLKIEAIAKNFKIFWSLQVRTYVNAYRTLRVWSMVQNRYVMEPTMDNIPEFKICDFCSARTVHLFN